MRRLAVALLLLAAVAPALALQPDEIMRDPAKEARARAISAELRCLVCQNQSIDDSDAPLARDLRLLVRERIGAGESDAAVRDFVVRRYGEFVLLRPVIGWHTALLWVGPPLILGLAGLALVLTRRRSRLASVPPLSASEEEAIRRLSDGAAEIRRP